LADSFGDIIAIESLGVIVNWVVVLEGTRTFLIIIIFSKLSHNADVIRGEHRARRGEANFCHFFPRHPTLRVENFPPVNCMVKGETM
jgi:hypothetical protein